MKLPLNRSKITEDIGMIKLQIVENCGFGAVVDELGAFVEKSSVVLIRFDDKEG